MKEGFTGLIAGVALWVLLMALAVTWRAAQSPAATKRQVANPYQDSRALEFGSKPRATYRPLESATIGRKASEYAQPVPARRKGQ